MEECVHFDVFFSDVIEKLLNRSDTLIGTKQLVLSFFNLLLLFTVQLHKVCKRGYQFLSILEKQEYIMKHTSREAKFYHNALYRCNKT